METFSNSPSWLEYKRVVSEEFGIILKTEPLESRIDVRGHQLRVDEWTASPARGTLILVHGGGGNGRILAPFAELGIASGWRVLAPDLPGFGLTQPAAGYRDEYEEWPAVISALAKRQPGPVVLMGLSMGGLTAFIAARNNPAVAGVIATTLLDLNDPQRFIQAARWRWLGRVSLITMKAMPWLFDHVTMPLSLAAPLTKMSSNRRMQSYFERDPLIGRSWKSARFFRTAHDYRVMEWRLHCPLLVAHPGDDTWTPTALSRATYSRVESAKQFVELENGAHLPLEKPAYEELGKVIHQFLSGISETTASQSLTLQ